MRPVAGALQLSAQFSSLDLRLQHHSGDIGILVVRAGANIECVSMPRTNDLAAFDRSFAQWPTFMRTRSIEHADRSIHVGHA